MTSKVNNQTLAPMNNQDNLDNHNLDNIKGNKQGKKYQQPKKGRSAKLRRTADYWLKTHNAERRKQIKVKYNKTHTSEEQLTPKDIILEEIHLANFLGCEQLIKDGSMKYNSDININMCDMFCTADDSSVGYDDLQTQLNDWRQQQILMEQQEEYNRQQEEWGWMINDCNLDNYGAPDDEEVEQDREDNYTKLFYDKDQKRYRIWKPISGHPKGGRIVCESDDENSQGSCR